MEENTRGKLDCQSKAVRNNNFSIRALKNPGMLPQRKLLIWMKKRGIVRTLKNLLQSRPQVVSRTDYQCSSNDILESAQFKNTYPFH